VHAPQPPSTLQVIRAPPMSPRVLEDRLGHARKERLHDQKQDGVAAEADWQVALQKLRQELQQHCKAQTEALKAEVTAMTKETEQRWKQNLRQWQSTADAMSEERLQQRLQEWHRTVAADSSQVRGALQSLSRQVRDCKQALDNSAHPGSKIEVSSVPVVVAQIEAERVIRSERVAELHQRIGREVGDLGTRCEQQRLEVLQALANEREDRGQESKELRAIIDSVWDQASAPVISSSDARKKYFKVGAEGHELKEVVGDADDINTLYDMVREALGDSVNFQQQIAEEQRARTREAMSSRQQVDQLAKQLNTVQALLREAALLSNA